MARVKKTTKKSVTKKATPKKEVKKVVVETKPTYTLTEEQYDKLYSLINWDNPLSKLDDISEMGKTSLLEIGFKVGIIYNEFEKMLNECSTILVDIQPELNKEEEDEELYGWDIIDTDEENN